MNHSSTPSVHTRRLPVQHWCLTVLLVGLSLVAAISLQVAAFPRTVVDGTGQELYLAEPPQRIFSTALPLDNILLHLVAPERVAAVTLFATQEATGSYVADRVAPHMEIIEALNAEQVLLVNPDLILIASWNDADAVAQVRLLGYPIYTFTDFGGIDDALHNIQRVGEITGTEERAQALIDAFYLEYGRIAARIAGRERPRVLFTNERGFTGGAGTSPDGIIQYAGGVNVAAEVGLVGWHHIDGEFILEHDPDVIITDAGPAFAEQIRRDRALSSVQAVQHNRVYAIQDMDALTHHTILAIAQLASLLHPEAFADAALE